MCALVTGVQTCALPIFWWLALAGLPVFQQSLPESPEEPAVLAIAAGHVSLRAPCYRLVCPDAEWLEPTAYTTLWKPRVPGTVPRLRPARASPLATRSSASLPAPATKREWFDAEARSDKVATTSGMQAQKSGGEGKKVTDRGKLGG